MVFHPSSDVNGVNRNFTCGVVEGFYGRPWTTDQRKRLFQRMKNMGMNTYLYAPKDDSKHRMNWRELYSVEEADHLTGLVKSAMENDVEFVYAISPGLDMTYSSTKEMTLLKRKLEQVQSFGCKAFALLFDDIEVDMNGADKEIFQSFAQAQVSVTNEAYQHLGQPRFLFCPTEYCTARAVPNVSSSEYLTTLGNRLLPEIDVMWTGPKVVSKKISIKSIQELSAVLKRPPVIWDNIHANDYDQKRLFLGPYDGRSPELLLHVRGVLTNPNCEFEANFIAMHTLAQWSRSTVDSVSGEVSLSSSPVSADIKLEAEEDYSSDEECPTRQTEGRYHPKSALATAIGDWMQEFYIESCPASKRIPPVPLPTAPVVSTCMSVAMATGTPSDNATSQPLPVPGALGGPNLNELASVELADSYLQPSMMLHPVNSLADPFISDTETETDSSEQVEPMDCLVTPGSTPSSSSVHLSETSVSLQSAIVEIDATCSNNNLASDVSVCSSQRSLVEQDTMQIDAPTVESSVSAESSPKGPATSCRMTSDQIATLIDLFYMPFEHGSHAQDLLNELCWLKSNAHMVSEGKKTTSTSEQVEQGNQWQDRVHKFRTSVSQTCDVLDLFCAVPNKALLYDLFPYVWDMKNMLFFLVTFTDWLALGHVPYVSVYYMQRSPHSWTNKMYQDAFTSGENEPWVFRGGLQAEFQRLLPVEGIADLLTPVFPPIPASDMYSIRPYDVKDEAAVYNICRKCYETRSGTVVMPGHADLPGDWHLGAFLTLSPEYCFVMTSDSGEICGYVVACLDARMFFQNLEISWLPDMKIKYPSFETEKLVEQMHNFSPFLPEEVFKACPSLVRVEMLPDGKDDLGPVKRALACAVMSLKVNGSHGIYTDAPKSATALVEFYNKLGLFDLPITGQDSELAVQSDTSFMGRIV